MKKLLSLLSILSISGTAIPTTIAASPYQKEETINRNKRHCCYKDVNYLKQDLSVVIENDELGFLYDDNDEAILNAIKNKNNNLDINKVKVVNKNRNSVLIRPIDWQNLYFGWSWKKVILPL
ncbi:MAG: hypothetical protein CXB60_02230 [Spiroplasma poulsonii]|nr:hypothetical protein [Spiroplasma poulsonii]